MKLRLNEDLFDDVVDIKVPNIETEITLEPELDGPQTGEEVGIAGLLLDAISNCASNINQYNIIQANINDEVTSEVLNDIINNENISMGKLQSLLKTVSPNAESIMTGAVDAEQMLDPGSPVDESLEEDWKDGEFTKQDFDDWDWEMTNATYRIQRSIKNMLNKHYEYRDEIISTAKQCRNILADICSLYNE